MEDIKTKKRKRVGDDVEGDINQRTDTSEPSSPAAPASHTFRFSSDDEDEMSDGDSGHGASAKADKRSNEIVHEDTPSTSPTALENRQESLPLAEVSSNVTATKGGNGEVMDDDDDVPVDKSVVRRRNVRAGFIIDDSDSDKRRFIDRRTK